MVEAGDDELMETVDKLKHHPENTAPHRGIAPDPKKIIQMR